MYAYLTINSSVDLLGFGLKSINESLNGMKLPSKEKMSIFTREDDICLQSLLDQTKYVEFA